MKMKKSKIVTLVLITSLLASCSADEDTEEGHYEQRDSTIEQVQPGGGIFHITQQYYYWIPINRTPIIVSESEFSGYHGSGTRSASGMARGGFGSSSSAHGGVGE